MNPQEIGKGNQLTKSGAVNLIKKLLNDSVDEEINLVQDLVAIAMADGKVTASEKKALIEICQREGLTTETLDMTLQGFKHADSGRPPRTLREKHEYLSKLITIMDSDGDCSHLEIYLLEMMAAKINVSRLELVSLVLMHANRRHFPGDVGAKVLSSFLKNHIDPKAKSLMENKRIFRNIFDCVAQNTPMLANPEEDRKAFVASMNAVTGLLMENALLAKEFRNMGLDLETVLMDELEQAIRRWILER